MVEGEMEELRIYVVHPLCFSMQPPTTPTSLGNKAVSPLLAPELPSVHHRLN